MTAEGHRTALRLATDRDLAAIVAIYNDTIPGRQSTADLAPVSVEDRRAWFARHNPDRRPIWVVEDGGAVVAWLSLDDYKDRAAYSVTAELSVYVAAGDRRAGHARTLVAHALATAPSLGITTLLAVVFAHNTPSIALFERFGFERWGHLPAVTRLDGRDADVLILGRPA